MKLRNLLMALLGALVALALVATPSYADLISPEDQEPIPIEEEKSGFPVAAMAVGAAVIAAGAAVFIVNSRKFNE